MPDYFKSELDIRGMLAPDLHSLASGLGATIEQQVVDRLNELRSAWDPGPDPAWPLYSFRRQAQKFPDVILAASAPDLEPQIAMGIELKGWYALAKEKEPSFRHRVTPAVATEYDLLVVIPWALSDAIAGSPLLFRPHVVGARFAAEYRNYWWQHIRSGKSNTASRAVVLSTVTNHYPEKSELINDKPASDSGGNFGRYSRTGLMDDYIRALDAELLRGIPLGKWRGFLAQFSADTEGD